VPKKARHRAARPRRPVTPAPGHPGEADELDRAPPGSGPGGARVRRARVRRARVRRARVRRPAAGAPGQRARVRRRFHRLETEFLVGLGSAGLIGLTDLAGLAPGLIHRQIPLPRRRSGYAVLAGRIIRSWYW